VASIVIPAHNEARTIARLLRALLQRETGGKYEILVVCNGCTDETASIAAAFDPAITVLQTEVASKKHAMDLGNRTAVLFPRVFIDADVVIDGASINALLRPLSQEGILATGPRRSIPMQGVSLIVRSYYQVWQALPQSKSGLFGRGVVALSESGIQRYLALPNVMSDDLAISEAFGSAERVIVDDALVTVNPPRTVRDLIRRRIRIVTGNRQADILNIRGDDSRTSVTLLLNMVREEPRIAVHLPAFLLVTMISRIAARKALRVGDFTSWRRDESSRT
jgi:hypothetical protein